MMMKCCLLCALLVLALCCCPSVCDAKDTPVQASSQTTTSIKTEPTDTNKHTEPEDLSTKSVITAKELVVNSETEDEANGPATTLRSPPEGEQGKGKTGSSGSVPAAEQDDTARDGQSLAGPDSHSSVATSTLEREGTDGTSESQSHTSTAAEKATEEAKDSAQMTTTTTTTTTEALTTTTTHAPSRLREVDGSLSSSAWVCAPLVLAASALAYTAVG
ncbi:putative mucin TcMUCII [Trypanosoma cruzi]|uniref:Mucin TcMUCII, putative n=2 Tax=Trypanosoma cruzi TaxID=5693 RepID=Q4DTZ8_TRYCC|nr:mucin TcMUCII, putative [Trypanosoma cruzi]EAN96001.1 mucin TcMUCII, putative [Trypanosoma cruzi]PWV03478.1 putative mucin TcMUCII [Trypanosoma cruzi]RNC37754.1 mucin TcMUCII [Trypanosoma cruzi]|eukprot:XP_817852.1 mucin TcMUCII [Trypanosoma cruzi strain CL Brener]